MPVRAILSAIPQLVVVAEDEPLILALVAETLRDAQFHVIEACNAAAALAVLDTLAEDVCLLFTDVSMPVGMTGIELAAKVRLQWPWISLLLASGARKPAMAELPHGSRFMTKPYDPHAMVMHVRALTAL